MVHAPAVLTRVRLALVDFCGEKIQFRTMHALHLRFSFNYGKTLTDLTVGARVSSVTLANVAVHFVVALTVHARVRSALVDVCSKETTLT